LQAKFIVLGITELCNFSHYTLYKESQSRNFVSPLTKTQNFTSLPSEMHFLFNEKNERGKGEKEK
jgi:hypothetical protein